MAPQTVVARAASRLDRSAPVAETRPRGVAARSPRRVNYISVVRAAASLRRAFADNSQEVMLTRVFVSIDYDNDEDLKRLLINQARFPDSLFDVADWSIKQASSNWRGEARRRIRAADQMVVLCGQHTETATGVSAEVKIAPEERIPYFLLWGRNGKTCVKPTAAKSTNTIYKWTWANLKELIGGAR